MEVNPHDWVPSKLGHGESMCRKCMITNREAAALGRMNTCSVEAPREAQVIKLRRRRDAVSAFEVLTWLQKRPKSEWRDATILDINQALDDICGTKT